MRPRQVQDVPTAGTPGRSHYCPWERSKEKNGSKDSGLFYKEVCWLRFVLGIHVFRWRLITLRSRNSARHSYLGSVIHFNRKTSNETAKQSRPKHSRRQPGSGFCEHPRTEQPCPSSEASMTTSRAEPRSPPEKAGWLLKPCFTFTAMSSSCKEFQGQKTKWQPKKSHHSQKHVFIKKVYILASMSHSAFPWPRKPFAHSRGVGEGEANATPTLQPQGTRHLSPGHSTSSTALRTLAGGEVREQPLSRLWNTLKTKSDCCATKQMKQEKTKLRTS